MLSPRSFVLVAALVATAAAPARAQRSAHAAGPDASHPARAAATVDAPAPAPAALVVSTPAQADPRPLVTAAPAALNTTAAATLQDPALDQERAALQARARGGFSHNQVLMIVGGAAFVAGLVIGDDAGTVLALGGAGVGLYGLYRYLQER